MPSITAIVISKNEQDLIVTALKTLRFATEVILVDSGSTDNTIKLARPFVKKIIKASPTPQNFAAWRNLGAKHATSDWLLYLDADERVTPELAQEITRTLSHTDKSAFTIHRYEILLGKHLNHWPDSHVLRLIKKSDLIRWSGKLHEQPQIKGHIGHLRHSLIHLTHRNFDDNLSKTLHWSKLEGELLFKANHPPMSSWRFFRIIFTEFFHRFFVQGLWRDGTEGTIEAIYQSFSRFLTYVRLWEFQHQPPLKQVYQDIDKRILQTWKK